MYTPKIVLWSAPTWPVIMLSDTIAGAILALYAAYEKKERDGVREKQKLCAKKEHAMFSICVHFVILGRTHMIRFSTIRINKILEYRHDRSISLDIQQQLNVMMCWWLVANERVSEISSEKKAHTSMTFTVNEHEKLYTRAHTSPTFQQK